MKFISGFTLIEVLVAIFIVALALASGLRAAGLLVDGVQRQRQIILAQICAENKLAQMRFHGEFPLSGLQESSCVQAERTFRVRVQTSATPNPSFVKLDVMVYEGEDWVYSMSALGSEF